MSNGGFENIHQKLLDTLEQQAARHRRGALQDPAQNKGA
jgi:hypothetical protein